jgi:hypothetical protein
MTETRCSSEPTCHSRCHLMTPRRRLNESWLTDARYRSPGRVMADGPEFVMARRAAGQPPSRQERGRRPMLTP